MKWIFNFLNAAKVGLCLAVKGNNKLRMGYFYVNKPSIVGINFVKFA
jgi:hypothetical protein